MKLTRHIEKYKDIVINSTLQVYAFTLPKNQKEALNKQCMQSLEKDIKRGEYFAAVIILIPFTLIYLLTHC